MTTHSEEGSVSALERADHGRRSDQPYSSLLEETGAPDAGESALEARGRAPRISREDVFSAADALLVEGSRPTIDRVRMRLGRGSPNTINDHLDSWWQKLGSRLRDLPGREFPQLPERVAASLGMLWNEALAAAHEVLAATLARREEALLAQAHDLQSRREVLEREQLAVTARTTALEEALRVASSQLEEANQRARTLEETLLKQNEDLRQLRSELDRSTQEYAQQVARAEEERAASRAERSRLEARHETAEARWLGEVDRGRQSLKAAETSLRDLQLRLDRSAKDRDTARLEVQDLRAQLATANAVREQLEARLRSALEVQKARSAPAATKRRRKKTSTSRRNAAGPTGSNP